MGDFKQQFNNAFQSAPSFSNRARENVKTQLHQKRKKRWMPITAVAIVAVALVSFIILDNGLLGRVDVQDPMSIAAPEHIDKTEIFAEVIPNHVSQFAITNLMNSMNRGKEEYKGGITIETQFDDIQYGQVLLLEDGMIDDTFKYVLGRVIGKPGDKVAIEDGQLYLNDLPIETFYGKAQVMGTTDVDDAFERLKKVNSTEWRESIEEALHYSLEPFILKENELFIVSDNWARNSVRQTFTYNQIEGIVLGYTDVTDGMQGWRELNDEELEQFKRIGEQVIADIKTQEDHPYKIETGFDLEQLSEEFVEHEISYISSSFGSNSALLFKKMVLLTYLNTGTENKHYFHFSFRDGKWEYAGEYYE